MQYLLTKTYMFNCHVCLKLPGECASLSTGLAPCLGGCYPWVTAYRVHNWSGKASMDDLSLNPASAIWRQLPDRRSPRSRAALSGSSWKTTGSCREGGGSSAPFGKVELWLQSEKGHFLTHLDNSKLG